MWFSFFQDPFSDYRLSDSTPIKIGLAPLTVYKIIDIYLPGMSQQAGRRNHASQRFESSGRAGKHNTPTESTVMQRNYL